MLVHRRVTPSIKFLGTHLYTWVERGTVRVKCLAQEHNTMSPARARTWSTRSGVKRANHEATAPPNLKLSASNLKLTNNYEISLTMEHRTLQNEVPFPHVCQSSLQSACIIHYQIHLFLTALFLFATKKKQVVIF